MTSQQKRLECQRSKKIDRQFLSDADKLDGSYVQYEISPLESGDLIVDLFISDGDKTLMIGDLLSAPEDAEALIDKFNKITDYINDIKFELAIWMAKQKGSPEDTAEADMDKLLGAPKKHDKNCHCPTGTPGCPTNKPAKKKMGRPKGSKTVKKVEPKEEFPGETTLLNEIGGL